MSNYYNDLTEKEYNSLVEDNFKSLIIGSNNNSKLKRDLRFNNEEIVCLITEIEELFDIVIPDSMLLDKVLFEDFDPTVNFITDIIKVFLRNKK